MDQARNIDGQRRSPVEGLLRVKSCNSLNKRISAARYTCRSCFDAEAEGMFSRFRARQFHGLTLFEATRLPSVNNVTNQEVAPSRTLVQVIR